MLKNILNNILDLIFPIECLGCKKEGVWICPECAKSIPINTVSYCPDCKVKTKHGEFCKKCKNKYSLDGVLIASDYNNQIIKKAIKTLKYRFAHSVSQELGQLLFLFFSRQPELVRNKNWLVVPVPLHPKRLRWRGFNQAEKICYELAHAVKIEMDSHNLARIRHTKSQTKLLKKERQANVENCFKWQGEDLSGRDILIIDDVATTGSTLKECALILKDAGAGEVWGMVAAKG